jgi:hypothetical protein
VRSASGARKGPERGFGGTDLDGFADLGARQRRNFDPQIASLRARQ